MDTSFAIHHKNQCIRNQVGHSQSLNLDVSCGISKSRGILPTPDSTFAMSSPNFIFKTPHPTCSSFFPNPRKSPPVRLNKKDFSEKVRFNRNPTASFTEIWAGPTYFNSPPPSSLPIPTFWMKPGDSPQKSLSPISVLADPTETLRCLLNLDVEDDVP